MKPTTEQPVPARQQTSAATAARRSYSQAAVERVRDAVTALSRHGVPVTTAGIARRAGVSRTFIYTNPQARALVDGAKHHPTAGQTAASNGPQHEAGWRERALNAEDAHKQAIAEIRSQREQIGRLLGQIRDLHAEPSTQDLGRITTENTRLQTRNRQLGTEVSTLTEKLSAARSNLRFLDKRIADLEAQLADPQERS